MAASSVLVGTAAGVAFLHTAIGVDHTVPFVALGRARGWSLGRTLGITALCGAGHVASSVILGALGAAAGLALGRLSWLESARGTFAAWLLIAFGLVYAAWSLRRNSRSRRHDHVHVHADGTVHAHPHDHRGEHGHPHGVGRGRATPWVLFIVFAFGPCETLIPLMIAPVLEARWLVAAAVVAVFGCVTVGTMLALVALGYLGLPSGRQDRTLLARHADTLAGLAIVASGAAVLLAGV